MRNKLQEIKQLQEEGFSLPDSLKIAFKSFYYSKYHICNSLDEYLMLFILFLGGGLLLVLAI
jgi:hypothetical protein